MSAQKKPVAALPTLLESLQGRDLGHLRIVADLWGLDFNAPDSRIGRQRLVQKLLNPPLIADVVEMLPGEARRALNELIQNEGIQSWALFSRRFGLVREMGVGRRDREKPYLSSASPTEVLFYRALMARTFFDSPTGPIEYAYIPQDLLPLLPAPDPLDHAHLGRPATPLERAVLFSAGDRLLDHATTLLAALRLGLPLDKLELPWPYPALPLSAHTLRDWLEEAGLLDDAGLPLPEPTRAFLEAPRAEALLRLTQVWVDSVRLNDLRRVPSLQCEGDWQNDPLQARRSILDFLSTVPGSKPGEAPVFWSLTAFCAAVRQFQPDFQRPAGDYDSWFLRSRASGEFLRGFEQWDTVEGELIRYLVSGPLFWLGLVELAGPGPEAPAAAFRWHPWNLSLLHHQPPKGLRREEEKIQVGSQARLRVPRLVSRAARYQLARFCEWEGEKEDAYLYRLTAASLERARSQGLHVAHLLTLLRRQATALPPALLRALERWEERGSEARLEKVVILRLGSPDILQALRASKAARFLGEPLGPTTVVVKAGAWHKVVQALAEMGYLTEGDIKE